MNIKDIAGLAGVSKSTVSRVLNNAENVDPDTRERVLRVVNENNYLPSALARNRSKQGNNVIGVILPEVDDSFFGKIVQGINEELLSSPYSMLLSCTDNNPELELKALNAFRQQRVRGILLTTSYDFGKKAVAHSIKQTIDEIDTPIVLLDRTFHNSQWDGVFSDNVGAAYQSANALTKAGFSRIGAFISDMKLTIGQDRYKGFQQALDEAGMTADKSDLLLYDNPVSIMEAYQITCSLIKKKALPEAIFLSNRLIANGFIKALFEHNIMLGQDIHCIGFDYSETLDIVNAPYSYMERNAKLLGQASMELLEQRLEQTSVLRKEYVVPSVLHIHPSLQKLIDRHKQSI